jgi:putative ATPase
MDLPFPSQRKGAADAPLAERMRPATLDELLAQERIVGPGTLLRRALEQGEINQSMILWGPPGCGKTTLARLIAASVRNRFVPFSAVTSGIADVKAVIRDARKLRPVDRMPLLLFVDEIHRFNKAQQDAFLPHIEDGTIVFIGATTENPSFEVIGPLLSRSRVFVLEALDGAAIRKILERAVADEARGLGKYGIEAPPGVLEFIADMAQGDARVALNALEYAASVLRASAGPRLLTDALARDALQQRMVHTDKNGESHFNLISALHKSLRGGDADAALYWLARMCEAGEDALYIARRLVRFASEDVGNADPQALALSIAAKDAVAFVGYPECKLALAQCVVYLALAPKSNAVYAAYESAAGTVHSTPPYPVPMDIRNAPTRLMKDLGYGRDYLYPHDHPDAPPQDFLPDELRDARFYRPRGEGFEAELRSRIDAFLGRRKGGDK